MFCLYLSILKLITDNILNELFFSIPTLLISQINQKKTLVERKLFLGV